MGRKRDEPRPPLPPIITRYYYGGRAAREEIEPQARRDHMQSLDCRFRTPSPAFLDIAHPTSHDQALPAWPTARYGRYENDLFNVQLTHRYNVLDWFHITDIWSDYQPIPCPLLLNFPYRAACVVDPSQHCSYDRAVRVTMQEKNRGIPSSEKTLVDPENSCCSTTRTARPACASTSHDASMHGRVVRVGISPSAPLRSRLNISLVHDATNTNHGSNSTRFNAASNRPRSAPLHTEARERESEEVPTRSVGRSVGQLDNEEEYEFQDLAMDLVFTSPLQHRRRPDTRQRRESYRPKIANRRVFMNAAILAHADGLPRVPFCSSSRSRHEILGPSSIAAPRPSPTYPHGQCSPYPQPREIPHTSADPPDYTGRYPRPTDGHSLAFPVHCVSRILPNPTGCDRNENLDRSFTFAAAWNNNMPWRTALDAPLTTPILSSRYSLDELYRLGASGSPAATLHGAEIHWSLAAGLLRFFRDLDLTRQVYRSRRRISEIPGQPNSLSLAPGAASSG
ncbi:hypothetical protein F5Y17DRAFT_459900 [Xylariaceae sp. FL0594]|nr:hypothetical protein F5Y17DRAFT_459900 [Xylariaceae sp. FL0594]